MHLYNFKNIYFEMETIYDRYDGISICRINV